mmetsp:Transcript_50622/g.120566  ORF Transcript_50622/g.120566 Transcript_50622/m.120566 type:complete len:202 (-) Transcript_50622:354-959(-)
MTSGSLGGGLKRRWYTMPVTGSVRRATQRSTKIASGTSITTMCVTFAPAATSSSAWFEVLGKPSRTQPFSRQSAMFIRAMITSTMSASEVSSPWFITSRICAPSGVCSSTHARSNSADLMCTHPNCSSSILLCVNFPEPCAPAMRILGTAPPPLSPPEVPPLEAPPEAPPEEEGVVPRNAATLSAIPVFSAWPSKVCMRRS